MNYEDVHFKAGFRPLGTLDRQDKAWLMIKQQLVVGVWAAVIHAESGLQQTSESNRS